MSALCKSGSATPLLEEVVKTFGGRTSSGRRSRSSDGRLGLLDLGLDLCRGRRRSGEHRVTIVVVGRDHGRCLDRRRGSRGGYSRACVVVILRGGSESSLSVGDLLLLGLGLGEPLRVDLGGRSQLLHGRTLGRDVLGGSRGCVSLRARQLG